MFSKICDDITSSSKYEKKKETSCVQLWMAKRSHFVGLLFRHVDRFPEVTD